MIHLDERTYSLLVELTKKEIRLRYKRSVLGFGWSLLNPILMMGVFTLIFSRFPKLTGDATPYSVFFLCGYLPWIFFSQSCQAGKDAIVANASIVKQTAFERWTLPAAGLLANFMHFVLAMGLFVIYIAAHPGVTLGAGSFWICLLMLIQAGFCFGVVLTLSTLNVSFRDTGQLLEVGLTFLFYLTPVFYSHALFGPDDAWIVWVLKLNPMAHFVETYRALLTGGSVSWESIFYILVSTGGVIVFGRRFFHNHAPTFAKEL